MDNTAPHNEKQLLLKISEGDEEAFKQLFSEMHTALCFFAARMLKSEELGKDFVADIFLKLWETRKSLPNIHNISAFLYTGTRNRCLDYLKKVKHVVNQEPADFRQEWQVPPAEHFLQAIYDAEAIRQLDKAINTLPAECKKVVELGLEGATTNEIAEKLGISASAVSNQKSRAVKLLREQLPSGIILLLFALL